MQRANANVDVVPFDHKRDQDLYLECDTDPLAKAGFGADYEPTSEGRALEELIDKFFLK